MTSSAIVPSSEPMIAFDRVSHRYVQDGGHPFQALTGLSFTIASGSYAAICGRSGSGKSTLLNLISGLDKASDGTVRVARRDLGLMSENQLARWRGRTIGVVFQFFQLLPTLTISENLILAMEFVDVIEPAKRLARSHELLRKVGIIDHAHKFPHALSGGQQQRAAIARALANNPQVIIADEPTGNLDATSAHAVLDLFDSLHQSGVTLVVVTHDPAVAKRAHRRLELADGQLIPSAHRDNSSQPELP